MKRRNEEGGGRGKGEVCCEGTGLRRPRQRVRAGADSAAWKTRCAAPSTLQCVASVRPALPKCARTGLDDVDDNDQPPWVEKSYPYVLGPGTLLGLR